jgi:hypothetical protein
VPPGWAPGWRRCHGCCRRPCAAATRIWTRAGWPSACSGWCTCCPRWTFPELILPIIGLGDDAVVAAFVLGSVLSEVDAFLEWEALQRKTVAGEVIG